MRKIAAVTMLRNDDFFLEKWVDYYGSQLGKENLYVFFDGEDQTVPSFCEGVNVTKVPHVDCDVKTGDKLRINYISDRTRELFGKYDAVVGTDVDEFLIPDPDLHISLAEFLSDEKFDRYVTISGLGVDVGQNLNEEGKLDVNLPFLSQRRYARLSTRYTKSSVIFKPVRWGCGFHRVCGHNFHIANDLYLFHFGGFDIDRIKSKMGNLEMLSNGWSRHLRKRARTTYIVSSKKPMDWNKTTRFARKIQTVVRPPYAWNKPAMFELMLVVRIPDRFREIV